MKLKLDYNYLNHRWSAWDPERDDEHEVGHGDTREEAIRNYHEIAEEE